MQRDLTAAAISDNWQNLVPPNENLGRRTHDNRATQLVDFATQGRINASDDTGSVAVGPDGFEIQARNDDGSPSWGMRLNPRESSAEARKGNLAIGGSWAPGNRHAYVDTGSLRFSGGYGNPQGASSAVGAPFTPESRPGGWGKVDFSVGGKRAPGSSDGAVGAVNRAVSPYEEREQSDPGPESPREMLERQITKLKEKDPDNWWRAR